MLFFLLQFNMSKTEGFVVGRSTERRYGGDQTENIGEKIVLG
jgi:hypothetical protein